MKLVIVESPAKAKKIGSFLGMDYKVVSSVGHIRDLPVPSRYPPSKKEELRKKYGQFAVDVNNNFEPYYAILYGKAKVVAELKKLAKGAEEIFLATDEDREGEAIAWHILDILKPNVETKRMVFNEITKTAILSALENTRELDFKLVDAQESRRIIDRLFGFSLSPLLWTKFGTGLSAGRVQSVATRLIVEREKERMAFIKATFFDIIVTFQKDFSFDAKLIQFNEKKIAESKDFDDNGNLKSDCIVLDKTKSDEYIENLKNQTFTVKDKKEKTIVRKAKPPFTTSTLQQTAGNRLKMSASATMKAAQSLYEAGHITYMRTDSVNLSQQAITAAVRIATNLYGKENVIEGGKQYSSKAKNAQEAHEAIRPAGDNFTKPEDLKGVLGDREYAIYELIFKRTLASQMVDAKLSSTTYLIEPDDSQYVFKATGSVVKEKGFMLALDDTYEEADENKGTSENVKLPNLVVGDEVSLIKFTADSHETKPKARYTESSLVKKLEENGIGRPSTYASIIQVIQDREYVFKKGQALVPTWLAFAVLNVLESEFHKYVEYEFTAKMEEGLDEIATGENNKLNYLNEFYFGANNDGLLSEVEESKNRHKEKKYTDDIFDLNNGYQIHMYRSGAYLEKSGNEKSSELDRVIVPSDLAPDEITLEVANKIFEQGKKKNEPLGNSERGYPVIVRSGKYGLYFTEVIPEGTTTTGKTGKPIKVKPKMASLLSYMDPDHVTIDDANKVLSLPRELGVNPPDGEMIKVQNGRFGPYMVKNDPETKKPDYRSIKKTDSESAEERMFTITLGEAIEEYSHPKIYRRGRRKQ